MNLLQLLNALPALQVVNGVNPVFDAPPKAPPLGTYAVVSELTEGVTREGHFEADGAQLRDQVVTTLINLYGPQEAPLAALRPLARTVQGLTPGHLLDGTPVAGVAGRGPHLPVRLDPTTRRPWAAVRIALKHRTGV